MRRLLLAGLVVLSACGGLRAEDNDHPLADAEVPYDLLAAPTTTTTEPPPPTTTTLPWRTNLWYVAGDRVVPAPRQLRDQPDAGDVLRLLLRGPSEDDQPLVRTALDVGDAFVVGDPVGGTVTVALTPAFATRSPSEQVLALAQLVLTVTEVPGVGRVAFRTGDADLAVPLPGGQLAQGSVARDDYLVLAYPGPS
jgi:hypothetical protein